MNLKHNFNFNNKKLENETVDNISHIMNVSKKSATYKWNTYYLRDQ